MKGFRTTGHDAVAVDRDPDGKPLARLWIVHPNGRASFAAWIARCLDRRPEETAWLTRPPPFLRPGRPPRHWRLRNAAPGPSRRARQGHGPTVGSRRGRTPRTPRRRDARMAAPIAAQPKAKAAEPGRTVPERRNCCPGHRLDPIEWRLLMGSRGAVFAGRTRQTGQPRLDFGAPPAYGLGADLEWQWKFAGAHQSIDRRGGEPGPSLDFGTPQKAVMRVRHRWLPCPVLA